MYKAELTIVPFVPWHGAPRHQGAPPRPAAEFLERLFTFLQMDSHKAVALKDILLKYLESESTDFMNCRGQS